MPAPDGLRGMTTVVQGSELVQSGTLDPILAAAAAGAGLAMVLALCALLLWWQSSSKLKGIQARLDALSAHFEANPDVTQPASAIRTSDNDPAPSREEYLRLFYMYKQLKERVQLLEVELSRHTGATGGAQDAPAFSGPVQADPPAPASHHRSVSFGDVRARTRDAAVQLQALYDRPYPLQAEVSRSGAVFLRMNANGGLVTEPASGPHSDRWFLAVKDSVSEAYALYFGPRVARERTKLRVASDFLASVEAFYEVRQGFNNLELVEPCIIDIDASGTVSVVDRGVAQA